MWKLVAQPHSGILSALKWETQKAKTLLWLSCLSSLTLPHGESQKSEFLLTEVACKLELFSLKQTIELNDATPTFPLPFCSGAGHERSNLPHLTECKAHMKKGSCPIPGRKKATESKKDLNMHPPFSPALLILIRSKQRSNKYPLSIKLGLNKLTTIFSACLSSILDISCDPKTRKKRDHDPFATALTHPQTYLCRTCNCRINGHCGGKSITKYNLEKTGWFCYLLLWKTPWSESTWGRKRFIQLTHLNHAPSLREDRTGTQRGQQPGGRT